MRREIFHTPVDLTLDLRVPSGEIEVVAVEGTDTIVELDASGWTIGAGQFEDVQTLVDAARIELRQRGDGHEVIVDVPHKRRGLGLIFDRLNFRLRVTAAHEIRRGELALEHRVLQMISESAHRLVDLREAMRVADVVGDEEGISHRRMSYR